MKKKEIPNYNGELVNIHEAADDSEIKKFVEAAEEAMIRACHIPRHIIQPNHRTH